VKEDLFGTDIKAFEFFADEEKTFLLYEGEFSTTLDKRPPTPVPNGLIWPRADYTADDITWGQTPPGCTTRGINLTCEIEYRRYSDNSCLVGIPAVIIIQSTRLIIKLVIGCHQVLAGKTLSHKIYFNQSDFE
jgi:hypothetical protein